MSEVAPPSARSTMTSKLMRGAIWIAIGALIAAALVCVVWVLIGDQQGIIGRAFLTILLLAAFAGIAIVESNLAHTRPDWLALASMITWIVALLVGAFKIWLPDEDRSFGGEGLLRVWQLLLVVGILQLALVHVRLFMRASQRYVTTFTRVIVMVTFAMLAILVGMLVFFLTFPDQFDYTDLYWRIVIALTILVAVGTTLVPLLNALFAPRKKEPVPFVGQGAPMPVTTGWPTYADGRTPLPALPDASPDWNAYYTGYPTYAPSAGQGFPVVEATAQHPFAPNQDAAPQHNTAPGTPELSTPAQPSPPYQPAAPFQPPHAPTAPPQAPTAPPQPGPEIPAAPPAPAEPTAPPLFGSFPPPPPPVPGTAPGSAQ